jgi:metallo-beta-lactamase class B
MNRKRFGALLFNLSISAVLSLSLFFPALGQNAGRPELPGAELNQPFKPFRIIGNIYYVGTNDLACYLIVTKEGHILLDTGYEESGMIIRANIAELGFKLKDIKIMLSSHAHYDHVAGHADMKRDTGAQVYASAGDAPILESGGTKAFFPLIPYKPVKVDRIVKDGGEVKLGDVILVAHLTPGHTEGNTTWATTVIDNNKTYRVVFVGSMSINPGVHMVNFPAWPNIADVYAKSFQVLKQLPCDVFLRPHARFFDLETKVKEMGTATTNPFIDPGGYQGYISSLERAYTEQVRRERETRQ